MAGPCTFTPIPSPGPANSVETGKIETLLIGVSGTCQRSHTGSQVRLKDKCVAVRPSDSELVFSSLSSHMLVQKEEEENQKSPL